MSVGGDVRLQPSHQAGDGSRSLLCLHPLLFLAFSVNSVLNRNGDSQRSGLDLDFCEKNSEMFCCFRLTDEGLEQEKGEVWIIKWVRVMM